MTVILPLSAIINRPGLFKRRFRLAFFFILHYYKIVNSIFIHSFDG